MRLQHARAGLAPATPDAPTAESLGTQLCAALPPLRLHSVSLHDAQADVLWLNTGTLGPDEHALAVEAMDVLAHAASGSHYERALEDGRSAVFLAVRAPQGELVGLVMILADSKSLATLRGASLVTPPIRTILQRIAVLLRPRESAPKERTLTPQEVDEILSLDVQVHVEPKPELLVRQLIKLRSGGRTRRYEVIARGPEAEADASAPGPEDAALESAVLRRLIEWLAAHREVWENEPASFAVPVSRAALADEGFMRQVAQHLRGSGVAPQSIGFEIDQSLCIELPAQAERFCAACETLGCFVVLDDFTFDTRALGLLRSRALRLLKLDPRLTTNAMRDRLSQAAVIAIAQAAKVLGLHCVVKRAESNTARDWLAAVGCDFAQAPSSEKARPLDALAHAVSGRAGAA